MGAEIVTSVGHLSGIAPDIKHHHEKWDGSGYPTGLKEEEIPIRARILSLADAFDAMVSPRIYRAALSLPDAVAEVKNGSGSQFDPQVVEGLLWVAGEK
jgi:HD-GYP domain-containing protein (c-di-GMP phosphodiesterase class II)